MNRKRGDPGFTLLEMLVAICVLGLLTTGIARGLHLGAFSWSRAQQGAETAKQMRHAQSVLQDVVGGAYPAFSSANLQDHRIAFVGAPDSMMLVTRRPAALGTPVMIAARLFLDEPSSTLALASRLDLPQAPESTAVIGRHIAKLRLAYEGGAGWQDRWEEQTVLPAAIRISIEDADPHVVWPPLVIATHATAATACLFEPTDIECARTP